MGLFFNLKDVCVCTYTFAHAHTCMYELSHPKVQLQGDGLESFKRRMLSIMINGITSKGDWNLSRKDKGRWKQSGYSLNLSWLNLCRPPIKEPDLVCGETCLSAVLLKAPLSQAPRTRAFLQTCKPLGGRGRWWGAVLFASYSKCSLFSLCTAVSTSLFWERWWTLFSELHRGKGEQGERSRAVLPVCILLV